MIRSRLARLLLSLPWDHREARGRLPAGVCNAAAGALVRWSGNGEEMTMRVFWLLVLLIIVAAVGLFGWQNDQAVTLNYLDRSMTQPLYLLIGVVYLLGMVSGWTVVGFLKRSVQRVTESRAN
jgi:uncharacterized membrane protein YciS (DUF1049 family)